MDCWSGVLGVAELEGGRLSLKDAYVLIGLDGWAGQCLSPVLYECSSMLWICLPDV